LCFFWRDKKSWYKHRDRNAYKINSNHSFLSFLRKIVFSKNYSYKEFLIWNFLHYLKKDKKKKGLPLHFKALAVAILLIYFVVLRMEPRALHILGKHCADEQHPRSNTDHFGLVSVNNCWKYISSVKFVKNYKLTHDTFDSHFLVLH
jgi:hypothetical protein